MAEIQQFEIKTVRLDSDVRALEEKLKSVRSIHRDMVSQIDQLSSMWDGEAKKAFVAQFRHDCTILEAREKELEIRIGKLKKASKKYSECEARVGDEIASMRVGRT